MEMVARAVKLFSIARCIYECIDSDPDQRDTWRAERAIARLERQVAIQQAKLDSMPKKPPKPWTDPPTRPKRKFTDKGVLLADHRREGMKHDFLPEHLKGKRLIDYSPEEKREYNRLMRQARVDGGLCPCGRDKPVEGRKTCRTCLDQALARATKRRARLREESK